MVSLRAQCALLALVPLASLLSPTLGQEPAPRRPAEVIFIGANHNLSFLHPGFSPAHIRTLLSRIGPAAVCVEILTGWKREAGIPTYPQEQYAAITWADRQSVPVHAVDWNVGRRNLPPVVRMSDTAPVLEDSDRFRRFRSAYLATVRWTAARAFAETQDDLESLCAASRLTARPGLNVMTVLR
jgi:hypothetical protein